VPLSILIKDNLFIYLLKVATATWLNVIHTSVKELHYDTSLLIPLSHHEVKKTVTMLYTSKLYIMNIMNIMNMFITL